MSLAILGYFLQQQQQKRAEKLSEDQRKIADNETKEEVLQVYFDRLSVLLIDRNLIALSNKDDSDINTSEEKELLYSSLDIIRARTLSILRRFENDAKRKTSVIDFLVETEIVGKLKLNLSWANLSNADLSDANLSWANLSNADLSGANLSGTNLSDADLSGADLSGADLSGADLSGTDLSGTDLSGANLSDADLPLANLEDIEWNSETLWPDKSAFTGAENITEALKKELDIIS